MKKILVFVCVVALACMVSCNDEDFHRNVESPRITNIDDGATSIQCDSTILLSVPEGAKVFYSIDGVTYSQYEGAKGIVLSEDGDLSNRLELSFYAEKDGANRSNAVVMTFDVVHRLDACYAWTEVSNGYECTASSNCSVHSSFICGVERVQATECVVNESSCTEEGVVRYTSAFSGEGYEEQTKDVLLPMLPHSYEGFECTRCNDWLRGPAGGYVFYDCDADNDPNVNEGRGKDNLMSSECGWRYLEAAPADIRVVRGDSSIDSSAEDYGWSEEGYAFAYYGNISDSINKIVGTETSIGTGKANTDKLVEKMGSNACYSRDMTSSGSRNTTSIYAARLCYILNYKNDGVVYDDWFLPSIDELECMFTTLHGKGVGSFVSFSSYDFYSSYWSSSEYDETAARTMSSDGTNTLGRSNPCRVRPIRAFLSF